MSVRLPRLAQIPNRQEGVTAFSGLNHNLRIKDSEFYDMRNMTGDLMPVMASRPKRTVFKTLEKPNGLHNHNSLCWVDGQEFWYSGNLIGQVADTSKVFVNMGAMVLIFPDAVFYNTVTGDFAKLEAQYSYSGTVTCTLVKLGGTAYVDYTTGAAAPNNPQNGDCWIDTSGDEAVLRQWSETSSNWVAIETVYTKIEATGIGASFDANDGITISGMKNKILNGSFTIVEKDNDSITIVAPISTVTSQKETILVERRIPKMDYVIEHENRLYGCSSENHEIYVSALGNPKNWNQYLGIASDSFAATVGTLGDFTGAAVQGGYVMFFKEDCVHMISSYNSTFRMTDVQCNGIANGSSRSVCAIDGRLYYMGVDGIYVFSGGGSRKISDALGNGRVYKGIAGQIKGKYYITCINADNQQVLYVYDTRTGVWVCEDDLRFEFTANYNNELYALGEDGTIWVISRDGRYDYLTKMEGSEANVDWMLETGDIGFERQAAQFVSSIQLHAEADANCPFYVDVQYDGSGEWEQVYHNNPAERVSMIIPIIPRRARLIKLKLHGKGRFKLYSMTMRIETGSDNYAIKKY